ncbi:MAG TPA: YhcN/YlaJ family sporulation lipoprotein [Bacillota bacterium]|nr:YhcN/YlaJ family sporulation lipoprotein [Bacillota bacterium]
MRYIILLSVMTILFGCQTPKATEDSSIQSEPLSHENTNEPKPDYDGYDKSKKRLKEFKKNDVKHVQDEYANERTRQIAESLNTMSDINQAQVVETDDKIIAGVILNSHADDQLAQMVADKVRQIVNDEKEIVVYTDHTYWYQRIDKDARAKATQLGEDLEVIFDQFFDVAD